MVKQCLNIKQMQHLKDLGVDISKASMCWMKYSGYEKEIVEVHNEYCYEMAYIKPFPAFTFQDIFQMMPPQIQGENGEFLRLCIISFYGICYLDIDNNAYKVFTIKKDILQSGYEMLCWLAENKLLGKDEKE